MKSVERAFQRWLENQDEDLLQSSINHETWLAAALTVLVLVGSLTLFDAAQQFTGLFFAKATLCFVPAMVFGHSAAFAKKLDSRWMLGALMLGTSGAMFFFCAALIAQSTPQSKFIFAAMFFFAAGYYGNAMRATLREPFLVVGMWCGVGLAFAFDASPATITALLIMAIVGPFITIGMGTWQRGVDQQRHEREQLRGAIMAQLHQEQAVELHKLQEALLDLLASNHDLNNLLQTVVLNASMLRDSRPGEIDEAERQEIIEDIHNAALKIRDLSKTIRAQGRDLRTNYKAMMQVDIQPVLSKIVDNLQASHPKLVFRQEYQARAPKAFIARGEETLHRILDNVLRNACEGNGVEAAKEIDVHVFTDDKAEMLCIDVLDDGPGFKQEQLSQARPFETTKQEGTGLGLYIVEKWVLASGGKVTRQNRQEGTGAQVTIELPLWM